MELNSRSDFMKVLLHGCNGRMGQVLTKIISETKDMEVVCGVDVAPDRIKNTYPVYKSLDDIKEEVDIVIDFSNHSSINSLIDFGLKTNTPLVICTTGFTDEERKNMIDESKRIPIFNSGNMSLGVNLLVSLVTQAAKVLQDNFDVEIIEKHHNQKLDAPSGTALMIADAINTVFENNMNYVYERQSKREKREKNEIGIHSIRGGAIVGEHDVIFAGGGEVIEVSHTALSRDVFAYGAVNAARFMKDKEPGFYDMQNLVSGD